MFAYRQYTFNVVVGTLLLSLLLDDPGPKLKQSSSSSHEIIGILGTQCHHNNAVPKLNAKSPRGLTCFILFFDCFILSPPHHSHIHSLTWPMMNCRRTLCILTATTNRQLKKFMYPTTSSLHLSNVHLCVQEQGGRFSPIQLFRFEKLEKLHRFINHRSSLDTSETKWTLVHRIRPPSFWPTYNSTTSLLATCQPRPRISMLADCSPDSVPVRCEVWLTIQIASGICWKYYHCAREILESMAVTVVVSRNWSYWPSLFNFATFQ